MFDQETLKQLQANYLATVPRPTQQKQAQPQKKKGRGGLLSSLISEGGAIGGGAAGAAIGSGILPGVGTLLGGALGAGIGAFTGRVAENKVRDDRFGIGDAAKEGALSTVLGGGPVRIGKFGYEAIKGGAGLARGTEKTYEAVSAAKGIPVKYIDSTSVGSVGAKIPASPSAAVNPLDETSFIKTFKPRAIQAAKEVPGVSRTFASTGVKDPLNLVVNHLATGASKGEVRKIVNRLIPEGIDSSTKNSLIRSLVEAPNARQVKDILKQAEVGVRSQKVGAIKPNELTVGFRNGAESSSLLPAKDQATRLIETTKNRSLTDVLQEAGNKAVGMSATRAAGNKLSGAGEGLIAKEFRLNPTQQSNFKNLNGEEAVSVLRRYGVKKPEDLQASIKPLQDSFDGVVDKIPAASKSEVESAMRAIYKPLMTSPVLTRQQLGQSIKAQADEIVKKYGDQVPASELNTLRKSFDDAVTYTQRGTNEYTVNKKSADGIRKLLQGKADGAGITVDGKTFKDVGLELRKLRNLDDIVGKQAYLGTGNLPIGIGNLPGVGVGGAAAGLPGAVAGYAINSAVNSPMGRRAITNTTLKVGEKLTSKADAANPYGVKALAGRIAPVGLAGAIIGDANQSPDSNMTQQAMATTTNNMSQPIDMNTLSQTNEDLSTESTPFAPENLESSIQQILANGGSMKDASEFIGLAEALQKIRSSGQAATKPMSAESAKVVSNAQSGLQSLDALESTLSSDPGVLRKTGLPGRSLLGGALGNALGTASYDNLSRNILDVITRLRTGAALTAAEEKFYKNQLPQALDTPEVVQQKLGMFRDLFGSVVQKTGQGGTDQSSLVNALNG